MEKNLKEDFNERVLIKALAFLKNEEVKAVDTAKLVYGLQSIADLLSEYTKSPNQDILFLKNISTVIGNIVYGISDKTFKAESIINFQMCLVGFNSVVESYVKSKTKENNNEGVKAFIVEKDLEAKGNYNNSTSTF